MLSSGFIQLRARLVDQQSKQSSQLFLQILFCSRFVLNVPKEDQQSFERILFLVEYAHWFYEDNSVEKNPSLKSLTLKEFTTLCILLLYQFKCVHFYPRSILKELVNDFFYWVILVLLNILQCLTTVMF